MNINSLEKVSILILASGNGSNAENIIKFFQKQKININWIIITNNSKAGVIKRSQRLNVPYVVFEKKDFEGEKVLEFITKMNPFIIILAGFLLKIPQRLINKFPDKITIIKTYKNFLKIIIIRFLALLFKYKFLIHYF